MRRAIRRSPLRILRCCRGDALIALLKHRSELNSYNQTATKCRAIQSNKSRRDLNQNCTLHSVICTLNEIALRFHSGSNDAVWLSTVPSRATWPTVKRSTDSGSSIRATMWS